MLFMPWLILMRVTMFDCWHCGDGGDGRARRGTNPFFVWPSIVGYALVHVLCQQPDVHEADATAESFWLR
jgi:hypothetical protein